MHDYIDIGVNLTGSSFRNDLDEVIERAIEAGVSRMIVTGTDITHSRTAIELCQRYPETLVSTAGVHPHHASEFTDNAIEEIKDLCRQSCVVAIGECGLDFNRKYSTPEEQRRAFEAQLQLACETGLPVFLHQRDAHDEFVRMISDHIDDLSGAVAHCFTGTQEEAMEYIQLGLYIGVTGWICDERRGQDLQRAVAGLPLDRILLETDAPYLLPRDLGQKPVKERRNEPCFLPHIARATSGFMGISEAELAAAALQNTRRLFGI